MRSLEQFIQTVKDQNNFWQQNAFLTCSWRFLISNKLDQLEFKLEKNIGIYKHAEKVRKSTCQVCTAPFFYDYASQEITRLDR